MLGEKTFAFLDLETTGMNAWSDRVIEVGIVRVENGREVGRFQSLINPEASLPMWIERLTGIRAESLYSAPLLADVRSEIEAITAGALLLANNAGFDYSFMAHEMKRLDAEWRLPAACSVRYSRALYPQYQSHSLDSVSKRHGLVCQHRHRALDDADLIWQFFQKAGQEFSAESQQQALQKSYITNPA